MSSAANQSALSRTRAAIARVRAIPIHIRYRRALRSFSAATGNSVTSIFVSILTVPLLLDHLGGERYGVWITIYSFIAFIGLLDLGIGSGLVSKLSQSSGREETLQARRLVSSAFFVTSLAAALLAAIFVVAFPSISWTALFNIAEGEVARESGIAVAVLAACCILSIPASLARRAQAGFQSEYIASLWEIGARWVGLAGVLAVIWLGGGIPWVVLVLVGLPVLAAIINCVIFFGVTSRWLAPAPAFVDREVTGTLMRAGVLFFILQAVAAITFASDNIIIAQTLGPREVIEYSLLKTLFQFVQIPIALLYTPLWPAYGEALSRGEAGWIRSTLRRSLALTLTLSAGGGLFLVFAGDTILTLWVGPDITVDTGLWIGFALFGILSSIGSAVSMLLNAAMVVRLQVVLALSLAVCAVPLKIYFAGQFGVAGVIWAIVISYGAISLIPCLVFTHGWLKKL